MAHSRALSKFRPEYGSILLFLKSLNDRSQLVYFIDNFFVNENFLLGYASARHKEN
jgi:hypothetical protein